jgi:acid phosphatase (class A)
MKSNRCRAASVVVAAACILSACATSAPAPVAQPAANSPGSSLGFLPGYLQRDALPNSLLLLPPPPAVGAPAFAADEDAYRSTRALRGTPRWDLAVQDADLRFPDALGAFSCAINAPITEQDTPHLYQLLRRATTDAALATNAAKDHYKRRRPFAEYNESSCTPKEESILRGNGSYPSGHTSLGWTWALLLTELVPDRADPILDRGYAFGQSRVICGVHWQSDVNEGRVVASSVVARLHADETFSADLREAKKELDAVRSKGLKPTRDCAAETAALAQQK